jgi:hypothetical protein
MSWTTRETQGGLKASIKAVQCSDLKILCYCLEKAAQQQGLDTSDHSPQNSACWKDKRMDQLKWPTVA